MKTKQASVAVKTAHKYIYDKILILILSRILLKNFWHHFTFASFSWHHLYFENIRYNNSFPIALNVEKNS